MYTEILNDYVIVPNDYHIHIIMHLLPKKIFFLVHLVKGGF